MEEKETSNKFIYQEGEIKISKYQCQLCIYNVDYNNCEIPCSKYPNGKPKEILENNIKCPYITQKNSNFFNN